MRKRLIGKSLAIPLALVALLGASTSGAQTEIDQKLDQVHAFDANAVLDMAFTDPNVIDAGVPDFENLGLNGGGGLASCKLAPRGLYCLATATDSTGSYQVVRFWKDPKASPTVSSDLLRCDALPDAAANAGRCVSLTVDLSGAIWLSATNGIGYSLFKVVSPKAIVPGATTCASGWTAVGTSLCATSFASGTGVLSDLHPVDGEEVARSTVWPFGYGILALRNGVGSDGKPVSETLFFDLHAPTSVARNFGSWELKPGERLLSTSLLQVPKTVNSVTTVDNYILATTNTRLVAARKVAAVATASTPTAGNSTAFNIATQWENNNSGPASITLGYADWQRCSGKVTCDELALQSPGILDGATITAIGGSLAAKSALGGAVVGLGVNGASGVAGEIDVNEHIDVTFPDRRKVSAIQILFLFNGPEFDDPLEQVQITVDGLTSYTLQTGSADDGTAVWSGPGTVSKCGAMTSAGSGCFLISNPFPGTVQTLGFYAVDATNAANRSDFSIGLIETVNYVVRTSPTTGRTYVSNRDFQKVLALENAAAAPFLVLAKSTKDRTTDLALSTGDTFPDGITVAPGNRIDVTEECDNPIDTIGQGGCTLVPADNGKAAAKFGNVTLASNSTASGIEVFQVTDIPDCRYLTDVCYKLLAPGGTATGSARVDALIGAGWILPLASSAPDRYSPAAQLLNVTPLLPEDVTSKFDDTGVPPNGLPNLFISNRYRAANEYGHYFGGVFIKAQEGVKFKETFGGEFDVDELNGPPSDLGCNVPTSMRVPVSTLLMWDTITRVSETHRSVGGRYIDSLINVGCRNPIKTVVSETSFFPYLEIAPDTYGPTISSRGVPKVTIANDAVLARLVQSLYAELDETRSTFACAKGDGQSASQQPPLSSTACSKLAKLWSSGKQKLDKCVDAALLAKSSAGNENCQSFRNQFDSYKAALPATPTGADPANRLGEQFGRWEVIKHVFETRFLPSIPANGYCRERGACPPTP